MATGTQTGMAALTADEVSYRGTRTPRPVPSTTQVHPLQSFRNLARVQCVVIEPPSVRFSGGDSVFEASTAPVSNL